MNSGPPSFELESPRSESHAIADRVTVIGERTLLMREISVQSPSSVGAMFDRLETLSRDWERFSYVVDLTEAKRPGPETRAVLKERVRRVSPRVAHVAIVVGNNLLMRAMARLVAHSMGLVSVSVHKTHVEAIEEIGSGLER
jgi:hypothetical protein